MIDPRAVYECDCCGKKVRRLHATEAYGIETYVCDECYGEDEQDEEPAT